MNNVTLKQLRYVDALARHGHFGHAASACAVSQPALSVQIKELELDLGAALFERGPRQVRLTGFGADFVERARAILQAVDELGDLARAAAGPLSGRLRLGVIPTIAPYLLPRFLGRLPQSHPGLDVHLRETITPRLMEELHAGRIDAAVVALPVTEHWVQCAPLSEESFVLLRPASETSEPAPAPADLAQRRLLLLEEGHCFRDQTLEFCNLAGGAALGSAALEGSSLSTLVQMVGAGLGVTFIPEMAVPVETRRAPVDIVRFGQAAPGRRIGLIWRKSNPMQAQFSGLAEVLQAALE